MMKPNKQFERNIDFNLDTIYSVVSIEKH